MLKRIRTNSIKLVSRKWLASIRGTLFLFYLQSKGNVLKDVLLINVSFNLFNCNWLLIFTTTIFCKATRMSWLHLLWIKTVTYFYYCVRNHCYKIYYTKDSVCWCAKYRLVYRQEKINEAMAWIDLSPEANEQASSLGPNLAGYHFQNQIINCSSPTHIFMRSMDKKCFVVYPSFTLYLPSFLSYFVIAYLSVCGNHLYRIFCYIHSFRIPFSSQSIIHVHFSSSSSY